jgi:hypothetical protein
LHVGCFWANLVGRRTQISIRNNLRYIYFEEPLAASKDMPKLKNREKHVNFFLRVPPEARQAVKVEADRRGVKTVVIGREIVIAWAKQQNTPAA